MRSSIRDLRGRSSSSNIDWILFVLTSHKISINTRIDQEVEWRPALITQTSKTKSGGLEMLIKAKHLID